MKHSSFLLSALTVLAALSSPADMLELKNGKTLTGKYVGGTAGTIRFETSAGVQVVETSQTQALTFTGGAAATTAPAAAPAAAPVTLPAGTTLLVRTVDLVTSRDPQGKRFTTTLETDLAVNGAIVAKAGTKIYGRIQTAQQAGRFAGQSTLDLRLTEVAVGPNLIPILTTGYTDASARSGGKTARGAATGAAIGAIADGGDGAAKGAAIGAVASGLKKGESIVIDPGTLLEFKLYQPISVNVNR